MSIPFSALNLIVTLIGDSTSLSGVKPVAESILLVADWYWPVCMYFLIQFIKFFIEGTFIFIY